MLFQRGDRVRFLPHVTAKNLSDFGITDPHNYLYPGDIFTVNFIETIGNSEIHLGIGEKWVFHSYWFEKVPTGHALTKIFK